MLCLTRALELTPPPSPAPQRDGPNFYMTLHRHKVDDGANGTFVEDGCQPVHVPAGWQIADGSADDARVCAAHPWQSQYLVFANGDSYGTAACSPSYRGNALFALQSKKLQNNSKPRLH
jgi:hypothetical protein